ncbi:DUF3558 family protein [Saccharopolyspora gloriosae]|uniref:DUF3558 family protein n=1 Tax=Saccharopolyspora gloriosae TaxID=455344 RepID=UPI001FB79731|nr:DUF3558 family protein [Saccharopolyspora gloriosae]
MTRRSRSLISAIAGTALLSLSACALNATTPSTDQETPPTQGSGSGLVGFDPCAFFTPEDLSAAGVSGQGEPVEQLESEPGCSYEGEKVLLTLYKNQQQTTDSYETSGSWDSYEKFDINGRTAARGISAGSTGQGICNVVVDSGGGVAIISISGILLDDVPEPCQAAEDIARQVEPRLPR